MIQKFEINNFKKYPGGIYIHKYSDIAEDVEIGFGCIIHNDVIIEEGCSLLERCIIRPGVKIGNNCKIHDNVEIGYNHQDGFKTNIGEESVIRRGSTIYAGSTFGKGFQSGAGAVIREKCNFGEMCSVGTLTQFEGYIQVGKFSRFHTNVHIGQHSEIGRYVWVFPYVVFTNDKYPPHDICPPHKNHKGPSVKDYAVIATSSILMPNIKIGKDAVIAAYSNVTKDVPDGELWMGNPAKFVKKVEEIIWDANFAEEIGIKKPYPWRESFKKEGYMIDNKF